MKAIILKYDEERHDYIVEDLDDDRHLVIKESQLQNLKIRLGRVCLRRRLGCVTLLTTSRRNSMKRSCSLRSRNLTNEYPGCFDIFPSYRILTDAILSLLHLQGMRRTRSIVQRHRDRSATTTNDRKRTPPYVGIKRCHVYSPCNRLMTRLIQQG